jgi:hypothetical protein
MVDELCMGAKERVEKLKERAEQNPESPRHLHVLIQHILLHPRPRFHSFVTDILGFLFF